MTRLGALPETAGAIYRRIANRQWLACVLVCVLALGMRAALLPWLPVPVHLRDSRAPCGNAVRPAPWYQRTQAPQLCSVQ